MNKMTDEQLKTLMCELDPYNGGPLHIATEDFNMDDDHIAFCYKAAWEETTEPLRTISLAVAHELLIRSVEERAALFGFTLAAYEKYHDDL